MGGTALSPLHRLWQGLPQGPRRKVLHGSIAWLAPRPDRDPPEPRLGIAVGGELHRASGLGEGARLMLAGLRALAIPSWDAGPGLPPAVPLVLHLNPAAISLGMLRLGRAMVHGRRIIGVWPWELQTPPPNWRGGFDYVHEVWAPSSFSAAAIQAAAPPGFPPVRVVPHPVACDDPPAEPASLAPFGIPPGAVVTLVVFNLASSFARKNPLAAIAAHKAAFGTRPDRVLLMRVGNPNDAQSDHALLRQAAQGLPNIVFDTASRPRAEARSIMAAADIVLSLHRSEGFGLVPAEAMLMGKPVIATAWSGTEDFLDDTCAIRIPARLVPAIDPRGVFTAPGALWADPDPHAAAEALQRLADDPALRADLGASGRAIGPTRLGPQGLAAAVRGLGFPA